MNIIRIFYPESLSLNLTSKLDKSQSHYLTKVMRVKVSEDFSLFNERGEWEAKIKDISKGIVEFNITKQLRLKENAKEIWLAFSPIKSNYFNLMIQKATELGITKFIPVLTERTIVRKINQKRINKIIVEACEQSNRLNIPTLENLINLEDFLNNNESMHIIFGDLNSNKKSLDIKNLKNLDAICILIGPEGDFTPNERNNILNHKKIYPLKINNNILRSETAAISMISIVNFNFLS
jgi:16S rRNA (uracil1498-N3)-methyltransferase